jgi:hypothetical protein
VAREGRVGARVRKDLSESESSVSTMPEPKTGGVKIITNRQRAGGRHRRRVVTCPAAHRAVASAMVVTVARPGPDHLTSETCPVLVPASVRVPERVRGPRHAATLDPAACMAWWRHGRRFFCGLCGWAGDVQVSDGTMAPWHRAPLTWSATQLAGYLTGQRATTFLPSSLEAFLPAHYCTFARSPHLGAPHIPCRQRDASAAAPLGPWPRCIRVQSGASQGVMLPTAHRPSVCLSLPPKTLLHAPQD